jgi:pimeloyl-ACP methyl ester carboxylesterase
VLLHGFPSSSREFDTLIPLLATRYHLVAPDFPGFGQSEAPSRTSYAYTFDHLAVTMNDLLDQLGINKCAFYLHDYGGPVGFRMFLANSEWVQALIVQNANAYKEGLGAKWTAIAQYWTDPKAHPEVFETFVSLAATEQRHTLGTSHPDRYNPDTWTDEYAHLSRVGQHEIQADLLYDYRTNVASYERRLTVIAKHERWLADQHRLLRAIDELRGRDLVCFCAPRSCHGDLLMRLANTTREARIAWWRAVKAA